MKRDIISNMLVDVHQDAARFQVAVHLIDRETGEVYVFYYDPEPYSHTTVSKAYALCKHYGQKAKRDLEKLWQCN